jgi:hypothetical protein
MGLYHSFLGFLSIDWNISIYTVHDTLSLGSLPVFVHVFIFLKPREILSGSYLELQLVDICTKEHKNEL